MKHLILAAACLAFAACSDRSSPMPSMTTPSPVASSPGAGATQETPGDPNHFDPDPIRGYESAKWHDLSYTAPKYVFGRALVGLAPTAENLKRVAESQGLQYLGKDLVAFTDGTVADCIYDFEGPKARWQYQLSH